MLVLLYCVCNQRPTLSSYGNSNCDICNLKFASVLVVLSRGCPGVRGREVER